MIKNRSTPWKLEDWNDTVEAIVVDVNQAIKQSQKKKVWEDWRKMLAKQPIGLPAFQIDMIVREVRRKIQHDQQ